MKTLEVAKIEIISQSNKKSSEVTRVTKDVFDVNCQTFPTQITGEIDLQTYTEKKKVLQYEVFIKDF